MLRILLLCITLGFLGCEHWEYSKPLPVAYNVLWDFCQASLESNGYQLASVDQQQGMMQSNWQNFLPPLRWGGTRTKVILYIIGQEGTKPCYRIKLHVLKEQNQGTYDPMNPDLGIWLPNGYHFQEELLFISFIEAKVDLN